MSHTTRLALLAFLAALVVAGMSLLVQHSHSVPASAPTASPTAVVHRQDEAKALLFWDGDPSLAKTRAYVGSHHETVHYLESVTGSKDTPPQMLDGMAVWDAFNAEWHLFHITAPAATPAPSASAAAPAAARPAPSAVPVIPAAAPLPSPARVSAPAPVVAPAPKAAPKPAPRTASTVKQAPAEAPGMKNMAGGPAYTVVQDPAAAASFWASSEMSYTRSQVTTHTYLGSVPDRTGALNIDAPSPLLPGNLHVWDGSHGEWHLFNVK